METVWFSRFQAQFRNEKLTLQKNSGSYENMVPILSRCLRSELFNIIILQRKVSSKPRKSLQPQKTFLQDDWKRRYRPWLKKIQNYSLYIEAKCGLLENLLFFTDMYEYCQLVNWFRFLWLSNNYKLKRLFKVNLLT